MKRIILVMLAMLFILSGCSADEVPTANPIKTLNDLMLEEKVGQMIQVERSGLSLSRIEALNIGSVLSGGGSVPGNGSISAWKEMMDEYEEASAGSLSGIPVIYGIDAVHGNNNVLMATIFPHNIGLGAANDP
ncbi:MAG: glycoside hydrolase family 3 N-terminal domain-containing protein, partial [Bacillota bacterium]|nr:glycoside hydrolase family 3 N-terminal domain-containing protein [Bacillota bacterium]